MKTLWPDEKLLIISNFFFCHNVFKSHLLQRRLIVYLWERIKWHNTVTFVSSISLIAFWYSKIWMNPSFIAVGSINNWFKNRSVWKIFWLWSCHIYTLNNVCDHCWHRLTHVHSYRFVLIDIDQFPFINRFPKNP